MKPFNLEEAKAGKPVCTRGGLDARIICFDVLGAPHRIVGLMTKNICQEKYEELVTWAESGRLYHQKGAVSDFDLFMKSEKKKLYIAVQTDPHPGCSHENSYHPVSPAYVTKEDVPVIYNSHQIIEIEIDVYE